MADYGAPLGDPFLDFIYGTPAPAVDPLSLVAPGAITTLPAPPPPPPPPDTLRIGPAGGVVEETAAPTPPPTAPPIIASPPREPSVENVLGQIATPSVDAAPWPPPEWSEPEVDAVSSPDARNAPIENFLGEPTIEREEAEIEMPEESEPERFARLMNDPMALAKEEREWQHGFREQIGMRRDQEVNRDQWLREQNARRLEEARLAARAEREKIAADAQALADGKFGWSSKSTGQKVAGIIAVIAGGLATARSGGPNIGVQMLEKQFEQDYQAKKAALDARRTLSGERMADANEDFRLAEANRIAAYEVAIRGLESEAQKYDPQGRAFLEHIRTAQQLRASQAKALQDAETRAFSQAKDAADLQGKLLANEAARRKLSGVGVGGAGAGAGATKMPPEYFEQVYGVKPPVPMSEKEYKGYLATTKQAGEVKAQGKEAEAKVASRRIGAPGEFKNKDGTEFQAPTAEAGEKLRATKAALDAISQMRNEIARGIAEHGGESDFFKSDAWQKQKSRHSTMVALTSKALGLGALDEGTVNLAKEMAGGVDPTSFWRDSRAGLDQLVNGLAAKFNADLFSGPYDGDPYVPPKATDLPAPKADAVDKAYKELSKSYAGKGEAGRERPEGWTTEGVLQDIGEYGGAQQTSANLVRRAQIEQSKKSSEQMDAIYRAAIDTKSTARDKALEYLKKLSTDAPSDELKSQAFQLYNAAQAVRSGQGGAGAR